MGWPTSGHCLFARLESVKWALRALNQPTPSQADSSVCVGEGRVSASGSLQTWEELIYAMRICWMEGHHGHTIITITMVRAKPLAGVTLD